MAKDEKPSEDLSTIASQTIEQARGAMENYLNFFQKNMSASPWAGTELNKKVADYAQQNVATAFGFAQQLTQAKDLRDARTYPNRVSSNANEVGDRTSKRPRRDGNESSCGYVEEPIYSLVLIDWS